MNLRQKCKRLKQENERLKELPAPVSIPVIQQPSTCRIVVLGARRVLGPWAYRVPTEALEKDVTLDLASGLMPYIKFDHYPDENGNLIVEGRLKVVEAN